VGQKVFPTALRLLKDPAVELCHPEIVRQRRLRAAFPPQWHLKATRVDGVLVNAHAHVEAAWPVAQGEGIVIAVIDDGVDVQHEEFRSSGKIVAPRDVTRGTDDPAPKTLRDRHGHACAGVACADGRFGASGVAPRARLMPIRLASQLGSQSEADAFAWAADHGADVISCSWGPADGDPNDPHDPAHQEIVRLPDSTRLAIDYAATNGRDGKGCVVLFAAGNGNESVDNDGYASYRNVIAVAACSDQGTHSWYSDFGRAVWCAFPSNDGDASVTPGIWTTDRPGTTGYNPGDERRGDAAGDYTNSFGGTSSACPGAAGVAALALSRNPALRRDEVREILRLASDQIDKTHGQYDASGRSPFYGYGRLNAARAVELALPSRPTPVVTRTIQQDVAIKDLSTASLRLGVADAQPLVSIKVTVVIDHTYIGDLVVRLKPPTATAVPAIVLHNRTGGGTRNLRKTFDVVNVPGLAACLGKSPAGTWTLRIADMERLDTGTLRSFTLEFGF
jgi:subtilisin family serine protease